MSQSREFALLGHAPRTRARDGGAQASGRAGQGGTRADRRGDGRAWRRDPAHFPLLGIVEGNDPLAQMDGQLKKRRALEAIKRILLGESQAAADGDLRGLALDRRCDPEAAQSNGRFETRAWRGALQGWHFRPGRAKLRGASMAIPAGKQFWKSALVTVGIGLAVVATITYFNRHGRLESIELSASDRVIYRPGALPPTSRARGRPENWRWLQPGRPRTPRRAKLASPASIGSRTDLRDCRVGGPRGAQIWRHQGID